MNKVLEAYEILRTIPSNKIEGEAANLIRLATSYAGLAHVELKNQEIWS